jgi:hypothetical protein
MAVPRKINADYLFDELLISKTIIRILENTSYLSDHRSDLELIKVLSSIFTVVKTDTKLKPKMQKESNSEQNDNNSVSLFDRLNVLLNSNIMNNFLHVNEFEGKTYFNKERFEELLDWIILLDGISFNHNLLIKDEKTFLKKLKVSAEKVLNLQAAANLSQYDINKFKTGIIRTNEKISTKSKIKDNNTGEKSSKQKRAINKKRK